MEGGTDRDKATRRDGRAQAQSVTAINVLLLGVSLFPYRGGTVYWTSQGVGSAALDDGVVSHEPISFERYIAASCVVGRWCHTSITGIISGESQRWGC